jgi:dipeptidyl aminopeptidase/acylaminoacyl peptidase
VLVEDAAVDCVELTLDPLTFRPLAAMAAHARRRWHVVDPAYARDFATLAKASPGDLSLTGLSDDRRHWIADDERDTASGRDLHYDRASGRTRTLFSARPALDRAPLVPMEPVIVRARDGLPLVCYLSRPRGAARGGRRPMVLNVHGGPWGRDAGGLNATHQWLANRGYAVLSVNFRGSTGFGKAFVNAANLEWAGKMHDDLIDAVDWAVAGGVADPRRVAIDGASYGGYAALVGVTFTPEKFACAVDLFGISNLMTLMHTIPPSWKSWQTIWKARMGDQGANDVRVKPSESEQIVAAMVERGIPVTYVYDTDEGHGFRRPQNRRSFTAVVEAFLGQHLGGRVEPMGADFAGSTIEVKAGRQHLAALRGERAP